MSAPSWASLTTSPLLLSATSIPWGRGSFLRISCGERQPLTLPSFHRGEEKGEEAVTGQGVCAGELMRIALDVSPLARNRAGIGTHVANLLTALVQLAPDHKFFFYTSLPLPEKDHAFFNMRPHVRIVRCPSFLMGLRALWDRVDIFHGLNYKLRGWGRHGGVVTIHDLALDRLSLPSRKLFGQQRSFLRTRKTALRASRVVAVSE